MSKKLLLAAVLTFLAMALGVAFYSDGSLAGARPYYLGNVVLGSIVCYPLAVAVVVWEHRSSRVLKYCSAGAGLLITLILIWIMGPVAAMPSDLKTSVAVIDRLILILSCFIFSSAVISIIGRLSIRLSKLLCNLSLTLKQLSKVLPNSSSTRHSQYT
jgi:hypothetical protein